VARHRAPDLAHRDDGEARTAVDHAGELIGPKANRDSPQLQAEQLHWRPYQRQATNAAIVALKAGQAPLVVLPTGSGKSLIAADAARRAHVAVLRTLIIAPARELVQQDADAVAFVTGGALVPSLACAGLGRVDLGGDLIIGTPQTLARRIDEIRHIDLLAVDEAHRLGREASGQIRAILTALRARNPALKIMGLTATPFRFDSGLLIEGPHRVFDVIAFQIGYLELVAQGYLAPLVGPREEIERLAVEGLHLVGGDYSAADLARFDESALTARITDQIAALGVERKSWLVFGVSVAHAAHLCEALRERDVDARLLTGNTPSRERAELVAGFKAGNVRCLVGVDVFSTGFDAPGVDLIAVARPTCSPVWHVQSAGRGTRCAPGKHDCLILDFAGNFARLGPIDAPHVRRKGERARGDRDAPLARRCPHCAALIAARAAKCSVCDAVLIEPRPRRTDKLSAQAAADISGINVLPVRAVHYQPHHKAGRPASLRINYLVTGHAYTTVGEWICAWHPGFVGRRARDEWRRRLQPGAPRHVPTDAAEAAAVASSRLREPTRVRIWRKRDFTHVEPVFDPEETAS
jgi:DNA repair protein RadD